MLSLLQLFSKVIFSVLLLSLASAYAGVITFEDLPDANFFSGGGQNIGDFYSGITFGPDVTGLSVSRFGGYGGSGFPPHSGDVVIWDAADPTININFSSAISSFGIWYTAFDPLTLQAFDAGNNLLGTLVGLPNTDGTTGTTSFLSFTKSGITAITLTSSPGLVTFDDLSFQTGSPTTPEPSSSLMIVSALLGLMLYRVVCPALSSPRRVRAVRIQLLACALLWVCPLFCRTANTAAANLPGMTAPTPPRQQQAVQAVRRGAVVRGSISGSALAGGISASQTSDTTPPQLIGVTFSPTTINVSSSSQVVTVTLQVTDDLSGADFSAFRGSIFEFVSPSGKQSQVLNAGTFSLITGSTLNGVWRAPMPFPQFAESGNWTLAFVTLFDTASNHVTLNTAALSAAGYPTTLTVTTTVGDTLPPQLTNLTFSRPSLDVTNGAQTVDLTLSLTDNLSGVDFNCHTVCIYVIGFTSPSGKQTQSSAIYNFTQLSGTSLSGQWKTTITIPQHSEAGAWAINGLTVWDTANNLLHLTSAQIQGMGFPTILNVSDGSQDISPPTLTSLAFNPAVAGASPFRQNIVLTLAAHDDISGVDFIAGFATPEFTNVSVQLTSPSGIQNIAVNAYSNPFLLTSGNALNGVWQTSFTLPGYSETGTWTVSSITLRDSVANYVTLSTVQLTSLGIPTTFSVSASAIITTFLGPAGTTANPSGTIAEPINTATGNYYSAHTDLAVRGRGLSFALTRQYNSLDYYSGPLGVGWTHSYNVLLSANPQTGEVTVKNGDGSTLSFNPSGGGAYTNAPGVYDQLQQNSDNSFTLTRKTQVRLEFSSAGQLLNVVDRNGNTQTLSYDALGNLNSITDTAGRLFQFTYDSNNHLINVKDPLGRTVKYSYDGNSNLTGVQDPLGNQTQYAYDSNHRLTIATDPRSVQYVQNAYDGAGRVVSQKNGRGFTTAIAYNTPSIGTTTITDPLGNVMRHVYDATSRLVQKLNGQGGSTTYVYDANNDKISITNANGKTTTFTYDGKGNMTSVTNALGNTASFTYDLQNNMLTAKSPSGATTIFSYDRNGNLVGTQDALSDKSTWTYDVSGGLTSHTDAVGNTSRLTYDASGNVATTIDPRGNTRRFGYDAISRATSVTDENGHISTRTYDALSRRIKTTDALGNQTQYSYDVVGNLLKVIDPNNNPTAYQYDNANNLVMVKDALDNQTTYGYDSNNNRIYFTNAAGNTTTYEYNSLNRRVKMTDPLGLFSSYIYDAVGNVVSITDANGQTSTFAYNAVNRPTNRTYSDGNIITYSYDINGNRIQMTDSHGITSYGYDILNHLILVSNAAGATVKYARDALGRRAVLTYPDGRSLSYSYDQAGRLSQLTDWIGRKTSYIYDPVGNRTGTTMGNGATSTFAFDNANRILSVVNRSGSKILSSLAYSLDAAGNRIQSTDAAGGLTQYRYDALNRLTVWTAPSGQSTTYTYDAVGNRTSTRNSTGTMAYMYDASDRLLTAGTAAFTYDRNGNRLTKVTGATTTSYMFDALNRLSSVSGGGVAAQYQYDGDGNRIFQQAGASSYQYSLDVSRRNPSVLNENGSDGSIDFQYGLSVLSGSSATFEQFYQADGVGSTADVTDATDTLKASYTYDPWGKLLNPIDALGTKDKFKFAGEALDPQTGLYFLRARYYDPAVGRFISKDPLSGSAGAPATRNRYVYALGNPQKYTDTLGLAVDAIGGDIALHSGAIGPLIGGSSAFFDDLGSFNPPVISGSGSTVNVPVTSAPRPGGTSASDTYTTVGYGATIADAWGIIDLSWVPFVVDTVWWIDPVAPDDLNPCGSPGETCGSQIEYFPPAPTEPTFNYGDFDYLHPQPDPFGFGGDIGSDFGDFADV